MYELMRKHAHLLVQFTTVKQARNEKYQRILKEFLEIDKLYRENMKRIFNINHDISIESHKVS